MRFGSIPRRAIPRTPAPMFRFTIRDVLWLTVVAAVLCGWWLATRDRKDLLEKLSGPENKIRALESKIRDLENAANSQKQARDSIVIALAEELVTSHGRKLSGGPSVPGPNNPKRRILQLRDAESRPNSNEAITAEPTP